MRLRRAIVAAFALDPSDGSATGGVRRGARGRGLVLALACLLPPTLARAQERTQAPQSPPALTSAPQPVGASPAPPADAAPHVQVGFNAVFAPGDIQAIRSGLNWRVFEAGTDSEGGHALVAESAEATPTFSLADGEYIVHVACGLAGVAKPISVRGAQINERLVMNAGALKISGALGESPIPPARLNTMVYLPDHDDPEAKLIIPNLKADEPECLPEGAYHIVSKLMDVVAGATTPTNSTVYGDLRVQAGKLTTSVLRHRAATMTLKLVNSAGGEALANTSFSILTPGGDVIREMIGAFPSIVLAEGEYVAIARHENKTYQATFKVVSSQDRDVEVLVGQAAQ